MGSIATVTKGRQLIRNNPLPPSRPPSGHQQPVRLPEGGPPAASGPGGPEAGPLPGVRRGRAGPAGLRLRTRRSLARVHLVN